MSKFDLAERPNCIPWPPVIYVLVVVAAFVLNLIAPLDFLRWPTLRFIGGAICAVGVTFDLWAALTLWRQHTNILPHRAADKLVTGGPFSLSRNPIYVANTIALIGLGLALANIWLLAGAFVAAIFVHDLAILREEQHLAQKFGASWLDYAKKVPRWLIR